MIHNDHGEVLYQKGFLNDSEKILQNLKDNTPWSQDSIRLYGKDHKIPRLHCWYGGEGAAYRYSHILLTPRPWTKLLTELRQRLESELGVPFNSVLLNYYRNGLDSNGWHSDDEKELGSSPVIAGLSLGAERKFQLKRIGEGRKLVGELKSWNLEHNSLIVMKGTLQEHWKHQVPKMRKVEEGRLNLTFRYIHI